MWLLSFITLYISVNIVTSSVDNLQHPIKPCHIGDVVENECNRCTCSSKTVFECKALDCKNNSSYGDLNDIKQFCYPNQLYVQDLMTCICTKDGRWPHKSCSDTFQTLAPATIITHKCVPDSYVRIDCNVCRCGSDGQIVNDRCTRNACEEDGFRRTSLKSNNVYSNCEVGNWYSLAPCQFCFCVNENKLICNTGNYYSKKLELGSYNLKICGQDWIREAIELVPDNQRLVRLGLYLANASANSLKPRTVNTIGTSKSKVKDILKLRDKPYIGKIELNRENNENKTQYLSLSKEDRSSSSDEYYSDSDEKVSERPQAVQVHKHKQAARQEKSITTLPPTTTTKQTQQNGRSTKFPFQEGDEISDDRTEEDNEDDSRAGIAVEIDHESKSITPTPRPLVALSDPAALTVDEKTLQNLAKGVQSAEYQFVGNTLKINLPKVLNKVFQLALRKSMVSLSSGSKCIPGTTTTNGCNSCFCLKNSKLLCTKNICLRDKRTK